MKTKSERALSSKEELIILRDQFGATREEWLPLKQYHKESKIHEVQVYQDREEYAKGRQKDSQIHSTKVHTLLVFVIVVIIVSNIFYFFQNQKKDENICFWMLDSVNLGLLTQLTSIYENEKKIEVNPFPEDCHTKD